MAQYKKKPIVIEAFQWTDGTDQTKDPEWFIEKIRSGDVTFDRSHFNRPGGILVKMKIQTLEGIMSASPGDWIIKGVKGEIYPCKPDIFGMTYKEVG